MSLYIFTIVSVGFVIFAVFWISKIIKKRLTLMNAENESSKGKDKQAEQKYLSILAKNPAECDATKDLIVLYMHTGKYQAALDRLEKALNTPEILQKWPQAEIMYFAGYASKQLKKYHAALKYFLTVIGLNPNDAEVLKQLAQTYFLQEEYEKADAYFKKTYAMKDKVKFNKEFVKMFGISTYKVSRFADSIKIFESYIQLFPQDIEAHAYLGLSAYESHDYKKAQIHLTQGIQFPKERAKSLLYLGHIFNEQNELDKALLFYKKVTETKSAVGVTLLEAYYNIGNILIGKNNINDAVVYWNKIYQINPQYKDVSNKINRYSVLTSDEKIRQLSLSQTKDFIIASKKIIYSIIGQHSIDLILNPNDSVAEIFAIKQKGPKNYIIAFYINRDTDTIAETKIKDFYLKMKEKNCIKGYIVSIGSLTDSAFDFISARSIEYIDKNKLSKILEKIK